MQLRKVEVKVKATGAMLEFEVHALDAEQAVELAWHEVEEMLGGKVKDYEFVVGEPNDEPCVVAYEEIGYAKNHKH